MKKILIILALLSILLLSLTACDHGLAAYKEDAKQELESYVSAEDYSTENWLAVLKLIEDGKAAIMHATNKGAVDTAVSEAKEEIDAIKEEVNMGKFYSLQEAYNEGLLTVENLQVIANYHLDGTSLTETLSAEIVSAIREVAAKNMRESELTPVKETKAADFSIIRYYGTYNGIVALMINDPYHEYPAEELDINETIAGVLFHYTNPNRIVVWKK